MVTRRQIKAEVIKVMADAENIGRDPMDAARKSFPDFPEAALWECWGEFDTYRLEAWWKSMEKAVDAEMVKAASLRLVSGEDAQ